MKRMMAMLACAATAAFAACAAHAVRVDVYPQSFDAGWMFALTEYM